MSGKERDGVSEADIALARATLASAGVHDPNEGLVWRIGVSFSYVRAEEREACAKLVEDADVKTYGGFYDNDNGQATLDGAAAAIRARGQS